MMSKLTSCLPKGKPKPDDLLVGILVDVSKSMVSHFQTDSHYNDHNITRIQSVIKTIFDILKNENNSIASNQVFSLAFGLKSVETNVCDLIELVHFAVCLKNKIDIPNGKSNLDKMLKNRNVNYAYKFIDVHLTNEECAFVYALSLEPGNERRIDKIVKSLPPACTYGVVSSGNSGINGLYEFMKFFGFDYAAKEKDAKEATETKKFANKAKNDFIISKFKKIENPSIFDIRYAIDILESALDERNLNGSLNTQKLDMIIKHIEPYIYGKTPMNKALRLSVPLFNSNHENKVLFLITDGEAKDNGNPASFAKVLKEYNVTVIVCLITSRHLENPRQLCYSCENENFERWEKNMFDLASTVDNAHPMMSVLLERKWKLAPEGQSKLFFQANNPEIISEIGDIISAQNNDPILNIVTKAALDQFINFDTLRKEEKVKPTKQHKSTCYAHACSYAIYMSLQGIYKREGKKIKLKNLREAMIEDFGTAGANTEEVLATYCDPEEYNLRFAKVNENGAKIAVSKRHPVVATFALADNQWDDFDRFFKINKKGILKKTDLSPTEQGGIIGHAVILVKVTPEYLLFMNSYGTKFGDDGFFRVENAAVLTFNFYDIFWKKEDLKPSEIAAFEEFKKSGTKLVDKIPESIKTLPYVCPKCDQASPANTFTGHFQEAICPLCHESFIPWMLYFAMFIPNPSNT